MAVVMCDGTEEQKKKLEFVKSNIISYPDFPKPGILFWWDIWFIIIIIIIYVNEAVSRGSFVTVTTVNYLTRIVLFSGTCFQCLEIRAHSVHCKM